MSITVTTKYSKATTATGLLRTGPSNADTHHSIADRLKGLIQKSMQQAYSMTGVEEVKYTGSDYYIAGEIANRKNGAKFWYKVLLCQGVEQTIDGHQLFLNSIKLNLNEFGFTYNEDEGTLRDISSGWRIKLKVNQRSVLEDW